MPAPVRLPKDKILRCKSSDEAREIFNAMPEGHAVLIGGEVRVLRSVMMTFSPAVETAPATKPLIPFSFDR